MQARNAPFVAGKAIYCNGQFPHPSMEGCEVSTPFLKDLDLSTFTISAQFFIPRTRGPGSPVFVGGNLWRWVYVDLRAGGLVRLAYNSNQFVECPVRYRTGVWHEATITFDGRTATLYLDGVGGCTADVQLRTGNERVVQLMNSANATAFYGMLRELKVYNGVLVPSRGTPLPDTLPEPPPTNLAPVDLLLMKCPTRADLKSVDSDLKLSFDTDPTQDEPLACTEAEGSRDLTAMKKRVYNTLLLMRQIQFDQPLPWTKDPLYKWFTSAIRGIRFRGDITTSSCCNPARTINMAATNLVTRYTDRWVEPAMGGGLDGFLLVLVHEARHAQGHPHTCGPRDQTAEELGSWGVQYYLAKWLAEHADQTFFSAGTIRYTERLSKVADNLLKQQFCRP
jgi:hypothetical protein